MIPRPRPRPVVRRVRAALSVLAAVSLAGGCGPGTGDAPPAATAEAGPWPSSWRYPADESPAEARNGMVVTTDAYASEVGLRVLRDGGNAVDAAVAVSFALAVVNPEAGNIGGGGFMVVRMADGPAAALDYREKAPAAATRDMYLDEAGELTDRSVEGHLAAGVPGTVMGMWEAHGRFGSLPWERLLQPAVELAGGFEVGERFLRSLTPSITEGLSRYETSASTFLRGGAPPKVGDTLRLPELARTLERIRDQGPDGFYRGETAALIVAEMERGGGIITREDLASYTAAWRDPVRFEYRGYTVLSMPPSSSGGVTMAEAANILEGYEVDAMPWHDAGRVHLFAEAWRRAYADRNHYLADPDFVDQPLETLTSEAYARFRASTISPDAATPSSEVEPGVEAFRAVGAGEIGDAGSGQAGSGEEGGGETARGDTGSGEGEHTTHFSIVDGQGNAVAVTTTINSWYGSKVTVAGAGFVLNNEMDDFAAKPGTPNQYGLVQGENNAVEPGKRMLSAMTPSVVLDPRGRLFMVTGTPGGSTIITTVWQTISNVIDHGMTVSQAVLAPRIHHQHLPDQISYEPGGLEAAVVDSLRRLGHTVVEREGLSGDVQAILIAPDGRLLAQSDPRRGGAPAGY